MIVEAPEKLLTRSAIKARCIDCHGVFSTLYKCYKRSIKNHGCYRCKKCSTQTAEFREKASKSSKKATRRTGPLPDKTKAKISKSITKLYNTTEYKDKLSKRSKAMWRDPAFAAKVNIEALWQDPEIKARAIDGIKKHSKKYSNIMKEKWANDPEWRKKCNNIHVISTQQEILYSLLRDLKVQYEPEFELGFWRFDCMIPRHNTKNLLIEVQGDYFHGRPDQIARDKQKASFVTRYYNEEYELKTIWEHEFKAFKNVRSIVEHWLDIEPVIAADFSFKDVRIEEISTKEANIFMGKYHYFANAGRSGKFYAAKLGDVIVAACGFAVPVRKESVKDINVKISEAKELTRFCIADGYHKKNFASWCLSRFVKTFVANHHVKAIITFADETYGHTGTIYRACNWTYLHAVAPDYFYRLSSGKTMHKKITTKFGGKEQ